MKLSIEVKVTVVETIRNINQAFSSYFCFLRFQFIPITSHSHTSMCQMDEIRYSGWKLSKLNKQTDT